jgi:archaellum biogenesis ATPase FlaH
LLTSTILDNLILNEKYARKTLPFIREEYFTDPADQTIFNLINEYTLKYNSIPTKEALLITLEQRDGISEETYTEASDRIKECDYDEKTNLDFLINQTEDFCKKAAVYNAITDSIAIMEDEKKGKITQGMGAIPQLLSDALGVSFDTNIGHDYTEDSEHRYEFYHQKEHKIPFDIEYLNKITKGGTPKKTLSVLLSSTTGGGKSLCMCHFAATNLMEGLNVLYITMEMSEEMIAKRIDANLFGITLDELEIIPKSAFDAKAKRVKDKAKGRLIIKEYPTGGAHSGHFRHLINELKLKKNFVPDVIYIDYLNICSSARVKMSGSINTYTYVKTIAEELRGLAVEHNVAIWSATQGNRGAVGSSDILDVHRRFVVGVDRSKMTLFNCSEDAQKSFKKTDVNNKDEPIVDKGEFHSRMKSSPKDFTSFS